MKKRILITTAVIAAIHLVLLIGSVVLTLGSGMDAFENPDYEPPESNRVVELIAEILMQPGISLWTPWMSKNMPNFVEWGLVLVNSLLWGLTLAFILNAPALLKGKNPDNKSLESMCS